MDWFKYVSDHYLNPYTIEQAKGFVAKGKITADQFFTITGEVYTA